MANPVLMVSGVPAGLWSQEREGRRVAVTVEPFRSLTAVARKAVLSEVDRLPDPVEVHWVG